MAAVLVVVVAAVSAWTSRGRAQGSTATALRAEGAALFKLHCSSSYCHGEVAKGGGAPELRGHHFDPLKLEEIIQNGIPGTAMPGFSSRFSTVQLAGLVDYIRSLSSEAPANMEPTSTLPQGTEPSSERSVERVLSPEEELGRQLFFDASSVNSCRTCHTYKGRGGKVGPDLSNLDERDEASIRMGILDPSARVAPGFEKLQIVTRDGSRFVGVRRDEDATRIRFFDTSTMPPVSRSILKSEIQTRETLPGSVMPDQARLTDEQVRSLTAFLRGR